MPVLRADQHQITGTLAGRRLGLFDEFSGGDVTAQNAESWPAGQQGKVSRGGRRSVENITVTREYDPARDDLHFAEQQAGRPGAFQIAVHPLDDDGNPTGRPRIYTGALVGVTSPEVAQNSDDIADVAYELSVTGGTG